MQVGAERSSSPHSPVWCALQTWCGSLWGSSWVCRWRCRSNPEGNTCHRSPQSADGLVAAGTQTNVLKLCLRSAPTQETKRRWTVCRLFNTLMSEHARGAENTVVTRRCSNSWSRQWTLRCHNKQQTTTHWPVTTAAPPRPPYRL